MPEITETHTGAVGGRLLRGIICVVDIPGVRSTFDSLISVCGSFVFVAVHRQMLRELHVLLSFDGRSFTRPRQSL